MLRVLLVLHSVQIVHGDIKPDNWMLVQENELTLRIIDFGKGRNLCSGQKGGHEEAVFAFTGSSAATGYCCPAMTAGEPWAYQVRCRARNSLIYCLTDACLGRIGGLLRRLLLPAQSSVRPSPRYCE